MVNSAAIVISLLSATMWGTWFLSLKYMKSYPVSGFVLWLYLSSFCIVWGIALLLTPIVSIVDILIEVDSGLILIVVLSGALMALGMHIQLIYMHKVGLILVISVTSALSAIFGLLIAVFIGGIPDTLSVRIIILAAALLLSASYLCQYSGFMRSRDHNIGKGERKGNIKYFLLLVLSNLLLSCYVYGYAVGTETVLNPYGLPPLICVALLVTGSFFGAFISASIVLTKNKQWDKVIQPQIRLPILLGVLSGFCHYGGNILSVYAAPVLSVPITFLLGQTSNMWTYLWGILFREYQATKIITKLVLASGIVVYVSGILLITYGL